MDAGCGGEPRPVLSESFDVHLCLDISIVGLRAAKDQLGESGAYILADRSRLPFKDRTFDGVLASHCLYRVEKDKQREVVRELYRGIHYLPTSMRYLSAPIDIFTALRLRQNS